MSSPDSAGFKKAMENELETHLRMKTFDAVKRQNWLNVISSVWAFKRKRHPDGSVCKLKARICARRFEQQEGVDCHETFAPVAQWTSARVIPVMAVLLGLENRQIDHTAAFMQAPVEEEAHVGMPRLFSKPGRV